MKKQSTQFADKIRDLGYHINETPYEATVFKHGNHICTLNYSFGEYHTNMFAGYVPDDIKDALVKYSKW